MSIVYEKFNDKYECVENGGDGISILSVFVKGCDEEARILVADKDLQLVNGRCNVTLGGVCDGEYKITLFDKDMSYELGVIRKTGRLISLPYESAEMAELRKRSNLNARESELLKERIEMLEKCVFKTTIL